MVSPRLRRRSSAARLLRSWVRIPQGAWMFVCCDCCVLSGRYLCDRLITRPEESYWMWRVIVCDQETSKTRRLKPATGLWKIQPKWVVTPGKLTKFSQGACIFGITLNSSSFHCFSWNNTEKQAKYWLSLCVCTTVYTCVRIAVTEITFVVAVAPAGLEEHVKCLLALTLWYTLSLHDALPIYRKSVV